MKSTKLLWSALSMAFSWNPSWGRYHQTLKLFCTHLSWHLIQRALPTTLRLPYQTRGAYQTPSAHLRNKRALPSTLIFKLRGPYHNPHLPNQQEGLTNHPYIHNKISQIRFSIQLKFTMLQGLASDILKDLEFFFKPRIQIQKNMRIVKRNGINTYVLRKVKIILILLVVSMSFFQPITSFTDKDLNSQFRQSLQLLARPK